MAVSLIVLFSVLDSPSGIKASEQVRSSRKLPLSVWYEFVLQWIVINFCWTVLTMYEIISENKNGNIQRENKC